MKPYYLCIGLSVLCLISGSAYAEESVKLFSAVGPWAETNEWFLPTNRLSSLPKWKPQSEKIPLSIEKAIRIATKWIMAKNELDEPNVSVESIVICPIHPDENPFRHFFYYRITFGTRPMVSETCIVLMDGSVLEPERKRQ